MYKLGMTDKLPDPEDTHTPFFRTPSYYREKELKAETEAAAFPKPDTRFSKGLEFPKLAQANTGTRLDAGVPPLIKPDAFANRDAGELSPLKKLFDTMGQAYLQFNNSATAEDIQYYNGSAGQGKPENNAFATPSPLQPKPSQQATVLENQPAQAQPSVTGQATPVNPDNPDCLPRETAFRPDDKNDSHPFTYELTQNINRALTEKNGCKPYGIDFAQISKWEGGNKNQTYVPWKEGSKGNNSGVTVGSGVDFGQKNRQTLKKMGLSDELIDKLQNYLGLRQGIAKSYNNKNPRTFTWEEIGQINGGASLMHGEDAIRHWDRRVQQSRPLYPNAPLFHEMTSPQQTLVYSRYYHQGSGWIQKHPELFNSILENDWDQVRERYDKVIKESEKNGNRGKAERLRRNVDIFGLIANNK